ncbi:MAG: peptidoglycan DD-metalloendopeptidase family protein [Gammaproteobacteria bacterium]|nr:MAG: peptidoglycan DD-metalloendopeptidase family protein [Gammaproteobacteria bacterium]
MHRLIGVCAALILYVPLTLAGTPDSESTASAAQQKNQELKQLRARIRKLRSALDMARGQRVELDTRLKEDEKNIGRITRKLRTLDFEHQAQLKRLGELEQVKSKRLEDLARERAKLATQVRAAYLIGRQEQLKLVLNQEDPAQVTRMLGYYAYFNRARVKRIEAVNYRIEKLKEIETVLALQARALERLRNTRIQEQQALKETRQRRQYTLAQLDSKISRQDMSLDQMLRNEKELEQLVASLQRILAELPAQKIPAQRFAALKGRLNWPIQGKLAARYGQRRGAGLSHWKGALISAPAGRDIRAIAGGRVAFADWLRGYGLLIILDHGDGYMTLYGHSESLFKDTGEWVEAGDVIASVGASGGRKRPGLYFEIRLQGRPLNPATWFSGRPSQEQRAKK